MPPKHADTPRRATRASTRTPGPAPLPALDTRQSHAYGSRGKASLNTQITTSQSVIDDALAMPPPELPASKGKQKKSTTREPTPRPAADPAKDVANPTQDVAVNGVATKKAAEKARPESTSSHRPITGIDTTVFHASTRQKPQDEAHEQPAAQPAAPPQQPPQPPPEESPPPPPDSQRQAPTQPRRRRLPQSEEPARADPPPEPHPIEVFLNTAFSFLGTKLFWFLFAWSQLTCIAYLISSAAIFTVVKLPSHEWSVARDNWVYYTAKSIGYDTTLVPSDYIERQQVVNRAFFGAVDDMKNLRVEHHALSNTVGFINETVAKLEATLPNFVVVVNEDGKHIIPPAFWQALIQKMASNESAPLWDRFIESNDAKMQPFLTATVDSELKHAMVNHDLVSSAHFQAIMASNNADIERRFNETLRTFQGLVLQQAKVAARDAAKEVFDSTHIGKGQISALAYSNLVVNMDNRMRQANFFSSRFGAVVQHQYTSATWREPSLAQKLGRMFWTAVGVTLPHLSVNPTTAALSEWRETGDCWCADSPEDATVKLQIGVRTQYKVYPNSFVIEHIPATATRDIASAPRDFEVWVKMESDEEANKVKRSIQNLERQIWPGDCSNPPDSSNAWVCAMTGEYDIHAPNYQQTFLFPSNPWDLGLATRDVVLKATSNWGADHTCLYQIRLTGDEIIENTQSIEA
ncbi:hypothetical protein PRZ48_014074 [Zasmidium cellare]|uniref:SUN domain-containing protein n=1 Tax=Zasmidium cellare TaxID=395010 RepID=A0ABR0DZX2_ZASCE|nr:hypothetical protein PRZ48_014074 [Zasmidium cellare]